MQKNLNFLSPYNPGIGRGTRISLNPPAQPFPFGFSYVGGPEALAAAHEGDPCACALIPTVAPVLIHQNEAVLECISKGRGGRTPKTVIAISRLVFYLLAFYTVSLFFVPFNLTSGVAILAACVWFLLSVPYTRRDIRAIFNRARGVVYILYRRGRTDYILASPWEQTAMAVENMLPLSYRNRTTVCWQLQFRLLLADGPEQTLVLFERLASCGDPSEVLAVWEGIRRFMEGENPPAGDGISPQYPSPTSFLGWAKLFPALFLDSFGGTDIRHMTNVAPCPESLLAYCRSALPQPALPGGLAMGIAHPIAMLAKAEMDITGAGQ